MTKVSKSDYYAESELSFRLLNPTEFPQLLEKLWPGGALINLDGVTLALVSEEIKGSVHLFSARTRGIAKERLRLSLDRRGLKARLERKRFVDGVKYEKLLKKTRQKKKIASLLRQIQPVVAVLCKERATLVYKFISSRGKKSTDRYVTIGIDRVVAIQSDAIDTGETFAFYDVDIEGDGSGSELLFVRSWFFRRQLQKFLKPLTQATSKWRVASKASNVSIKKARERRSYDDPIGLFRSCVTRFEQSFPSGHLLNGSDMT